MTRFKSILPVFYTYLLVLGVFSIFRFVLFLTELDRISLTDDSITTIILSFIMGVRFDIVISGYILLIPVLVLFILDIVNWKPRFILTVLFYWIFILFSISFLVAGADIPYFNKFFSRFSIGAFEWMDNAGFVFNMLIQEPEYIAYFFATVLVIVMFFILLRKIFRIFSESTNSNIFIKIMLSLLFLSVILLGIRGRVQKKSPIKIGTAYFSNNSFLNQLGLNPVFTLMISYIDRDHDELRVINLMDNDEAITYVQQQLNISSNKFTSPIAREIVPESVSTIKPNVIVIIMESMSCAKMKRHGNTNNISPFLDSLSNESYYFENVYTAGKHTFNGIYGTLFSFPALYGQHPMKVIRKYDGIGSTLRDHGYSTTYFTTHDGQFDNIDGFLSENEFENIISQSDYPFDKIETTLGVPDDYMFEFSIPIIDDLHAQNKPFFVTLMTSSDHVPYFIPEYFTPKNTNTKLAIVEYADWSIRKFITSVKQKNWFDNTIFVLIADHGEPMSAVYDISLDYHHTPMIVYSPGLLEQPGLFDCIGGQIDVFPTIMGILKLPYVNNTLGIDLLKEKRPYIIINDDDKIGVLDNQNLLIVKKDDLKLFHYKDNDRHNYFNSHRQKAIQMKDYAMANMQVSQYLISTGKTSTNYLSD
jgi:phosphoglycerol transferase MdoB-like AlkP superfamily enzyme